MSVGTKVNPYIRIDRGDPVLTASSEYPGASYAFYKFGRWAAVGTSRITVWDGGTEYEYLNTAETLDIVSTSTADATGGTGTTELTVIGLDANWIPIAETIALNGTTPVTTTNSYLRTYRMFASDSGTSGVNAGTISATSSTSTVLQARILQGNNQTLMALDSVPAGYTCFLTAVYGAVGSGKDVIIEIFRRVNEGVTNPISRISASFELVANAQTFPFNPYLRFDEKQDIRIEATSSGVGTAVSAAFNQIFVRNDIISAIQAGL